MSSDDNKFQERDNVDDLINLSFNRKRYAILLLVETILVGIIILFWEWRLIFLQIVAVIGTLCFISDPLTQKRMQQIGEGLLMVAIAKSLVLVVLVVDDLIDYDGRTVFDQRPGEILWDDDMEFGTLLVMLIPVCILEGFFVWGAIIIIQHTNEIMSTSFEPLILEKGQSLNDADY